MDLSPLVPLAQQPIMAWLGSLPPWLRFTNDAPDTFVEARIPRTGMLVNWDILDAADNPERSAVSRLIRTLFYSTKMIGVASAEAISRMLADGPKLFTPTVEQFESLRHVKVSLTPGDFRSPFPALVVGVPGECRKQLVAEHELPPDVAPKMALVRYHEARPDSVPTVVIIVPFGNACQYFVFSDQPENPTIETAITRPVDATNMRTLADMPPAEAAQFRVASDVARAVVNSCLLLTHYGAKVAGPVDPAAYAKHRKKKHLAHFKWGDCLAVKLQQDVVVRAAYRGPHPDRGGSGEEREPQWVSGHWRAHPGYGAARAAGEKVPLIFVRPYMTRLDRLVGGLDETSVTYRG